MPTATVSSLTGQEPKATALDPSVQELEGGTSEQGGPFLPVPQPKETDIPAKMASLLVNVGEPSGSTAARDHHLPMMCPCVPIWAQSCCVLADLP